MPVDIEAVLALLPEMFPGVQQIPLKNIRPNPDNPGPPLTDQEIQDLAQNIAEAGLLNPIKVRPDRAKPLAEGVQLHPENPRLRGDGQPWAVWDFNYMILAGENRYRAFDYLKREAIPGSILNPTVKEAVKITHLDNEVRDRGWWAAYQSIEQYIQADPNLTQRQVAIELKMDNEKVYRVLRLLPLLNTEARALIVRNTGNSNKGIRGISEIAASRLAALGPGTGFKPGVKAAGTESQKLWPYPAIPPETQDLVRQTLEVAIDQELTEAGVKGLVVWVKDGGQPEKYQAKGQPGVAASHGTSTDSTSSPQVGAGARDDNQIEDEEFKPIPWSEGVKHYEYLDIPLDRVRVNAFLSEVYSHSRNEEQRAQAMQKSGYTGNLKVRRLSVAEKEADPDHDYELFDDLQTLKCALKLGWMSLPAQVYDIDEWEAVRLHNHLARVTSPLTWIEVYGAMEKLIKDGSEKTVAEAADAVLEDPDFAQKLFPILSLLNEPARDAIHRSVSESYEGRFDKGVYRFIPGLALLLAPLAGAFRDLSKTQKLVEKVVQVAIENEMWGKELAELVDWVLAGNAAGDFYVKEA